MRAMLLEATGRPLRPADVPTPEPGPGQVRVKVKACGVCRTDLHIVDGELPPHKRPVIVGHQIVGVVDKAGPEVTGHRLGDLV
jgi:alcohol dehydrogenase, propanol-preferring